MAAKMKNDLYEQALKMTQDPVFRLAVLIIIEDTIDKTLAQMKDR